MNLLFLIKVIYFFAIAILLAILEIQIEGDQGWASKLPTWKPKAGSRLDKIFRKISGQKELTGYHTALMVFLLLVFHLVFIWNWHWTIWQELELLAMFVLFTQVWDFLWFILNPKFSLHKFNKDNVWWHKKWWGWMPLDYYLGIFFSALLFLPETIVLNPVAGVFKILVLLGVNLILITLTVIFYPKAY